MSLVKSPKTSSRKSTKSIFLFHTNWLAKVVKGVWIAVIVFLCGMPLYIFSVQLNLFGLFGGMPALKAVENPENDLSSEVISADGVSLGRYFLYNRSQVTYDELSPDLVKTLIISEDHRFYQHSGIDVLAFPRVFMGIVTGSQQGGGSTITQQLAKNLYTQNEEFGLDGSLARLGKYPRRVIQKTKEWIISIDLERNFTKEEIIAMYLNTAPFGKDFFGIKVAAETYFGKSPSELNIQESAVLVGMLQATTRFNPALNPESSLRKRNEVLAKLFRHEHIKSREDFDSLRDLPIELRYRIQSQNEGPAAHFRNLLRNDLIAWCEENGYDLRESGLKIYTTIDSRMQRLAEEAMADRMSDLQKKFKEQWERRGTDPWTDPDTGEEIKGFLERKIKTTDIYRALADRYGEDSDSLRIVLNTKKRMRVFSYKGDRDTLFSFMDSLRYYNWFLRSGMMSMDPQSGAVRAWVGGINYRYFPYDHVKQGARQAGSTFKPFVYGKAMEDGFSPCFELRDISPNIKVGNTIWTPKNSSPPYLGSGKSLTLRSAMARSLNSVTAQLMAQVKPDNVVDFAKRLGIKSHLDPVMSLALGTSDVTLYEMVAAYCSFVNLGIYVEPYYITRIEDKYGNVVQTFIPQTRQVMDELTAYKMVYMLRGGVEEEDGTSIGISAAIKEDNEVGGKTGTTDDASDGWYMGITHNLVTGIWVGGDTRQIRFPTWSFGSGSKTARPIWDQFMVKVYQHPETGYRKGYFKIPSKQLDMNLDCSLHEPSEPLPVDDANSLDEINN
jgi:penicillin-binding protein 1A